MHFYLTRCDITSVSDNLYSVEILFKSNKIEFQPPKKKKTKKKNFYQVYSSYDPVVLSHTIVQKNRREKDEGKIPNKLLASASFPPLNNVA